MRKQLLFIYLFSILIYNACTPDTAVSDSPEESIESELPELLPLTPFDKALMSGASDNWVMAERVSADMDVDQDIKAEGEGDIIVNSKSGKNLILDLDHGDLELEIDFMVPKGSNSGIYFQGRYEVQILDSWGKQELTTADVGSIYPDHDEEANISSNGSAPKVNAAKAPGLWQNFKVLFRAPKFDERGNKISNAKFEYVYLNDLLIQENVEAPKPTRASMSSEEVAKGPLMIQGDHGPVAFKNLKIKKFGSDTLSITDIKYQLFTGGTFNSIPDFDSMTPSKEGTATSIDELQDLAGVRDHFALIFNAKLNVPKDGEYLLTTVYDDGGDVFINGNLVIHNGPKEYENQPSRGLVNLTAGAHDIKITYYQEVWGSRIIFEAEGPEIQKHRIGHISKTEQGNSGSKRKQMLIDPKGEPELLRGYVNYKDEKRTHALSVGDPSGVNFSYDLMEGSILNVWRGGFANVTNMWVGRGHSQLLLPQNAATALSAGIPIASLSSTTSTWPSFRSDKYKNKGYSILPSGLPKFNYEMGDLKIEDTLSPSSDGNLARSIKFTTEKSLKNHWYKLASADAITKMPNGLYSIGGEYYFKSANDSDWEIRTIKGSDELIAPVNNGSDLSYEIIW